MNVEELIEELMKLPKTFIITTIYPGKLGDPVADEVVRVKKSSKMVMLITAEMEARYAKAPNF